MLKRLYHISKKNFIIPHILFWAVSIVSFMLLLFYTRGFKLEEIDLKTSISILTTLFFLAISVYINLLLLIPKFFKKRKFILFAIFQLVNIILFILLNYFTSLIFEQDHPDFISEAIAEFILVSLFLIVTTALKFMRDSLKLQDVEIRVKEVEGQKTKAELLALKSQVNPHFFFNTLNSLYSLSLDKSEKAPDMILKLSELMRYVIYESQDNQVPLNKQLDFLRSYVYLEQMRADETLNLTFEVKGDYLNTRTDPLLFIAFIENAFKHGCKTKSLNPYIYIEFNVEQPEKVVFIIENNTEMNIIPSEEQETGFGLTNVRKRLELLYPDHHYLNITQTENTYRVELCICIQPS
ncbi:MAG: histidine kinase [Bacteroidales bacterium]|nr:histidine kinase [Bacteroidota bacterium]MBL6950056.1 histidine kinase [Bacteroidales bacterium]